MLGQFLAICLFSIGIAWLTPKDKYKLGYTGKRILTGKFQVFLIILLMGVFIGLRTKWNDTFAYRWSYEQFQLPYPDVLEDFDWTLGSNPGFTLLNSFLKKLEFSTQSYIMFYALISIAAFIVFIRKFSDNFPLSIYLFVTVGVYLFSAAAIKQTVATAIAVAAIPFALEKKWIRFILMILLAMTFHPYVLVYFAVPFLFFRPGTKYTFYLLGATVLVALSLNGLFGAINSFTENFGDSYEAGAFSGEGVNIFRVMVCNAPTLLVLMFRNRIFDESKKEDNLMINLTMMNGAIMIIGLFGTANYFARLANFFVIAQTVSIPWIINKLDREKGLLIRLIAIIGYAGFFYYQSIYLLPIQSGFDKISLVEYLSTIFRFT